MWFFYAFLAAFSWATADLFSKKLMNERGMDEYITLWARFAFAVPLLGAFLVFRGIPSVALSFWWTILIWLPGDLVASLLYIKAVKGYPLSLVVPLLSTAPVFMILTSIVVLGEYPSYGGMVGVFLVTLGAYTLNLHMREEGVLAPLKALYRVKGARYAIIAAFIFSVDTAIGKIALQASNPAFFSFFYSLAMALGFLPVLFFTSGRPLRLGGDWRFGAVGFLFAVGVFAFLKAIGVANIAYVSGVGRLSMVIAVLYGRFFFGEAHLRQRLAGSLIIFVGVFLILWRG
jgi:drug/metabolite transporter (DMT)-like permease